VRLALCTTSDPEQVDIVLEGLAPVLDAEEFDWIGDATRVRDPKPAPAIYRAAMCALDVGPDRAVAVEDTPESAGAALSAGLPVVGFPGAVAAGRDFQPGVLVVDRLQPGLLAVAGQGSNPTGGVAAE
jgi:beta-phosphoglucomutase-like phosphatase (HAD superfamily)